jgi:hypothetical protein
MIVYDKGFTIEKIEKIEYGQDIFYLEIKYNDINCVPEEFRV